MKRYRFGTFLGLFLTIGLVAGCGGGPTTGTGEMGTGGGAGPSDSGVKPGGRHHFLFVSNTTADWWLAVEKGMKDGGQDADCQVEMRFNDGTVQGQVNKLREALSLPGIEGVAVSVLEDDAPGIIDAMRELKKAGKYVIAIDSDVASQFADARLAYIGTDNLKAGQTLGKAAAIVRPEGGDVAVFVGTAASANARARSDGFFEGAGSAFKKTDTWEDFNDFAKNQQNAQNALTRDPDLGVLLGLWAYNAPILAETVASSPSAREKVSVVTFDLAEAAIPHLESGRIKVTVAQNPFEMGYQGVRLLKALADKDESTIAEILPDGKSRETGVRVIVPNADSPIKALGENVITIEEMKKWLLSKGLKSS